jgi:hypothetical protein
MSMMALKSPIVANPKLPRHRRASGFSAIEVIIGLAMTGIAAALASNSFMYGQRANALVNARLESGMAQQKLLDFLSEPNMCKNSNIVLDNFKFDNTRYRVFARPESIRLGASNTAPIAAPIIEKKDYGEYKVEGIEIRDALPTFYSDPAVSKRKRAMVEVAVNYRMKGSLDTKRRYIQLFVLLDDNDIIVDCYLHSSPQQICDDLGWKFDINAMPKCTPP